MSGSKNQHLRTPLHRARGLGSAKDGTSHWWAQRLTAIAMIPLAAWMVYMLIVMMRFGEIGRIQLWLEDPLVALPLAAFIGLMFYHGKLGIQVIIEDYIHARQWTITCLLLNTFICWIFGLMSMLAILKLHLSIQFPVF